MSGRLLTTRQDVALLRLVAQRLVGLPSATAASAVRWMTATQAQDFASALTAEGVHVTVNGRDAGRVGAAVDRLRQEHPGSDPSGLVADFSEPTDVARLRQLTSDLQQAGYGLASAASGHDNTGGQRPGGGPSTSGGNDDVIDAEFKET